MPKRHNYGDAQRPYKPAVKRGRTAANKSPGRPPRVRKADADSDATAAPPPPERAPYNLTLQRIPRSTERKLIRAFYESLTPTEWDKILGSGAPDTPAGRLLAVMHDPGFESFSIESLCREARVNFKDLVTMVSDHSLGVAIMDTVRHAQEVLESIAEDAKTRELLCDLCLGIRDEGDEACSVLVDNPRRPGEQLKIECPKCGGSGLRRQLGDARARETFLKLHGQLGEGPLVAVTNNTQVNIMSAHSQSVQRGQKLLEMGRRAAIPRQLPAPREIIDLATGNLGSSAAKSEPERVDRGSHSAKNSENRENWLNFAEKES